MPGGIGIDDDTYVDTLEEDAINRGLKDNYDDNGCRLYAHCLSCPLAECIEAYVYTGGRGGDHSDNRPQYLKRIVLSSWEQDMRHDSFLPHFLYWWGNPYDIPEDVMDKYIADGGDPWELPNQGGRPAIDSYLDKEDRRRVLDASRKRIAGRRIRTVSAMRVR